MAAVDFVQVMRECLVSALDTAPLIVAVTGRASGNIIAWGDDTPDLLPVVSYRITDAAPSGGLGDERKVQIRFRAAATTERVANELLGAVEKSLTYQRLHAATPSVEAYRLYGEEDRVGADYDSEVDAHVGDLDAVLVASNPNP
jgi:hypothetical protein